MLAERSCSCYKIWSKRVLAASARQRLIAAIFAALSDDTVKVIGESKALKSALAVADKIAAF